MIAIAHNHSMNVKNWQKGNMALTHLSPRPRVLHHPARRPPPRPTAKSHFTPTSGSWLNMVEIFFGIITCQAIRRGTFHSVKDLETAIGTYIDGWNERAHPFTWTKGADEIISHAKPSPHPKKTYDPRH